MCFRILNISHCNMIFIYCTINEQTAYQCYQLNFLVTYPIEFFYFHIYNTDFYAHSNDILQVLDNKFVYAFSHLKYQSI